MQRPRPRTGFDWSQIRHWDLFPKFDSDVVVQSKAGGCGTSKGRPNGDASQLCKRVSFAPLFVRY